MKVTYMEVRNANEVWIKHFQDQGIWYASNWLKVGIYHTGTYPAQREKNGTDVYELPDDLGNCIRQLSSPHGETLLKAMIVRAKK